jgi:hypothetical protein
MHPLQSVTASITQGCLRIHTRIYEKIIDVLTEIHNQESVKGQRCDSDFRKASDATSLIPPCLNCHIMQSEWKQRISALHAVLHA